MRVFATVLLAVLLGVPAPALAELVLPAGFTAAVYVTGEGFQPSGARDGRGMPGASSVALDDAGFLYLARTGRRYLGGEVEDLWPIYRIPPGGARLSPGTERRYLFGPPLPNPLVAAVRGGRELFVTTFDRDRRIGVLYRMVDGRIELFGGGTPEPGTPPVLRQPEGAAIDAAGNVYVADRDQGVVVRFDPAGRVLNARYVAVKRARVLAVDERDRLWIAGDGNAEAPWQRGPGEIWTAGPDGVATRVLEGPMSAGIAVRPGGQVFVAERQGAHIFVLSPDGSRSEFARFTEGDAPRALAFAPVTPETRRAGIAGDLFVVAIRRNTFAVNEILRISGPFERLPLPLPPAPR